MNTLAVFFIIFVVLEFVVSLDLELLDPLAGESDFSPNLKQGWYHQNAGVKRRCPICDSSVYSYCSDKLFHDSCCCHNPNNPYDRLPYQCQFADCSFLHANSCAEHKLITACCCINNIF